MAEGILNPRDTGNSSAIRPAHILTDVAQRRWARDGLVFYAQDLNALLAQLRGVFDGFGIPDVEGDDTALLQAMQKLVNKAGGTLTGGLLIFPPPNVDADLTVNTEGAVSAVIKLVQYSDDNVGGSVTIQHARGTRASPLALADGDQLGQILFSGMLQPSGGFQTLARVSIQQIEPPSLITAANQFRIRLVPPGSITPSSAVKIDFVSGLQLFDNVVIDADRKIYTRAYTVSGLPAASPAGQLVNVTDDSQSQAIAQSDGTSWRRLNDNQVVSATAGAVGVLGRFTQRAPYGMQELVKTAYQRLNDAGLLVKLKGLWVHGLHNSPDARSNWITPGIRPVDIAGVPVFTAYQGFTGDGSASLLAPTASVGSFGVSQDDIAIGCFVRVANSSLRSIMGQASGARRNMFQIGASGDATVRLSDGTNHTFTPPRWTGMFTLSRGAGSGYDIYSNDALVTSIVEASVALGANPAWLGTADTTGSSFSDGMISMSFIATALNATDVSKLYDIMVTGFLNVIGLGVANEAGTYTPTLTNVANVASSTAYPAQYARVHSIVTVSGKVDVTLTAGSTASQLGISLPIASPVLGANNVAGVAACSTIFGECAAIIADASNFRAEMKWVNSAATGARTLHYHFTYRLRAV